MAKPASQNKYKSPFGRSVSDVGNQILRDFNGTKPHTPVEIMLRESMRAEPVLKDPAIDALWERVNAGDGYGPDIEGGAEEVERMKRAECFRSVGVRLVLGMPKEQWRKEQAEILLDRCIEKGWSSVLPHVLALGESLDLHAALINAAHSGRPECARLLALHCDANQLDETLDMSPLMLAAARSNAKTVQALLPFSNIFAMTRAGKTIFNTFLGEPDSDIVNQDDGLGESLNLHAALIKAAHSGRPDGNADKAVELTRGVTRERMFFICDDYQDTYGGPIDDTRSVAARKHIEGLLRSARERHLIEESIAKEPASIPSRRAQSL